MRVYVLKYKRVEEAALLVRPLLSDAASVTLTQKLNAMTVTDRPEKLDQIGKILASFDVPPRGYNFAVKLVRARADVPSGIDRERDRRPRREAEVALPVQRLRADRLGRAARRRGRDACATSSGPTTR